MELIANGNKFAVPGSVEPENQEHEAVLFLHDDQITAFNAAARALFNASREQLAQCRHPSELSPIKQPCGCNSFDKAKRMLAQAKTLGNHQFYWLHQRYSGELFYAKVTLEAVKTADTAVLRALIQDLSVETRQLLDSALGRLMFSKSHDALMITDSNNCIVDVNPAFCQITGYQHGEVIGMPAGFMRSGVHDEHFYAELWRQLTQSGVWEGEIWDKHKQGHLFPKDLKICCVRGPDGHVMNYLALFSDTSEKIQHKQQLEKLAYYDTLTGLPNRALLLDTLERTVTSLNMLQHDQQLAVAFIDIDNFKAINDTRGHLFGDLLIKSVTKRIAGLLSAGDFLGRMSGDEFLLIIRPDLPLKDIRLLVGQIIEVLREPFLLEDVCQQVNLSIGVSLYPQDGTDSKSLIAKADIAMYYAKKSGGSHVRFYCADVGAQFFQQSEIELHLAEAIRQGSIVPKYQPKIDLRLGTVVGAEILARWQRPAGEYIAPDRFIAVAEQQRLIRQLSDSLLQQSAEVVRQQGLAAQTTLALNVSAQELLNPQFSQHFIDMLQHSELPPHCCEIEITESCLIENFVLAKTSIDQLRQQGIRVSIDDFGTGFCSLNYLRSLTVDTIKLDRSFVRELDQNNQSNIIVVKAIIDLAHQLGIKVLAEGVETQIQLLVLKELQCDEVQGFYFAPALDWPDFCEFVRQFDPNVIRHLSQKPAR
jgi:diguanylate cyclase (GGDEF)-like protein/PAS domain S-box-containing protein